MKDLRGDELLWGDEIEYGVLHVDPETKKVRLSLRAKEVSATNLSTDTLFHKTNWSLKDHGYTEPKGGGKQTDCRGV